MAIRIERIVIDDLDASTDSVGTYRFALEGIDYEIDLSEPNLHRLHAALAPFVTAGRRLPRTEPSRTAGNPARAATVRRWWAEHEQTHHLPAWRTNGPIPPTVHDAYHAAQHAKRSSGRRSSSRRSSGRGSDLTPPPA